VIVTVTAEAVVNVVVLVLVRVHVPGRDVLVLVPNLKIDVSDGSANLCHLENDQGKMAEIEIEIEIETEIEIDPKVGTIAKKKSIPMLPSREI